MKKLLPFIVLSATTTLSFAQGRISFENDSLHLVYFTTDSFLLPPADAPNAGKATSPAFGQTLTAELWGGTSSRTLSSEATTGFMSDVGRDGLIATKNFVSPDLVGGTAAFFQVQVYSTAAGSYAAASLGRGFYYGESSIFTAVPSTSVLGYNSIVRPGSPALSTWAVGSQNEDASPWGPGARGAIAIYYADGTPEPSTFALAGLGVAALMIARRRR